MAYIRLTNFAAKDALITGNPSKVVRGTELGAEFDSLVVADALSVKTGGALGTPSSGTLTNCTGTASGLTAGNVTTNANLTGHVTSVGNAAVLGSFTIAQLNTAVSDANVAAAGANSDITSITGLTTPLTVLQGGTGVTTSTGTGATVRGTSPTLTTPTFDSASLATISGTAPLYMCRAWVNFNGTGTVAIRASGNVSSITDNGTGLYTVNLTTAMPDSNFSIVGSAGSSASRGEAIDIRSMSTSAIDISHGIDSTYMDPTFACVAIFR